MSGFISNYASPTGTDKCGKNLPEGTQHGRLETILKKGMVLKM